MNIWPNSYTYRGRLFDSFKRFDFTLRSYNLPEGSILNWGCSSGETNRDLIDFFPERKVIGIDIEQMAIERARRNFHGECYCIDGFKLREELPGPYAGIFVMNNLLIAYEYGVINDEKFGLTIKDLNDCLVSGGVLVIGNDLELFVYQHGDMRHFKEVSSLKS